MNKMAVACVAICAACMAQAVTFTWTGNGKGSHDLGDGITLKADSDFRLAISLQTQTTALNSVVGAMSGNARVFNLSGTAPSLSADTVKPGSSAWHTDVGGANLAWTSTGRMPTGNITNMTLTFQGSVDSAGRFSGVTVQISHNGNSNAVVSLNWNVSAVGTWSTLEILNAYSEAIDDLAVTVDATVEPSVPEPTALALLALGVAGLALRRRMA